MDGGNRDGQADRQEHRHFGRNSRVQQHASSFPGSFEIHTVQQMGWAGCGNGELLRLAADHGFDSIVPEVIAVLSGDLERRIYRVVA